MHMNLSHMARTGCGGADCQHGGMGSFPSALEGLLASCLGRGMGGITTIRVRPLFWIVGAYFSVLVIFTCRKLRYPTWPHCWRANHSCRWMPLWR